ncbi:MAG: DUF4364 family protein [Pseudoflavonifractor sp.]
MPGFIHDMLDVKFLVLYIAARAAGPLDLPTLTDLTMIDDGIDYFTFAQALAELVTTEHLTLDGDCYQITDKGRKNSSACESSLPYSVKNKCSRRLAKVNAVLRRNAQVRADVLPRDDGTYTLRLTLDDDTGNLLTLSLFSPTLAQAERLAEGYKIHPEQVYNGVLDTLLDQAEDRGD